MPAQADAAQFLDDGGRDGGGHAVTPTPQKRLTSVSMSRKSPGRGSPTSIGSPRSRSRSSSSSGRCSERTRRSSNSGVLSVSAPSSGAPSSGAPWSGAPSSGAPWSGALLPGALPWRFFALLSTQERSVSRISFSERIGRLLSENAGGYQEMAALRRDLAPVLALGRLRPCQLRHAPGVVKANVGVHVGVVVLPPARHEELLELAAHVGQLRAVPVRRARAPQCRDQLPAEDQVAGLFEVVVVVDEPRDLVQPDVASLDLVVAVRDLLEDHGLGEEEEILHVARPRLRASDLPGAVHPGVPGAESTEEDAVLVLLVKEVVQVVGHLREIPAVQPRGQSLHEALLAVDVEAVEVGRLVEGEPSPRALVEALPQRRAVKAEQFGRAEPLLFRFDGC